MHNESTYWGYTSVFNILDLSAAVLPVGTVQDSDSWEKDEPVMSEEDGVSRQRWDADRYRDAPVSVQVVGRRFNEEAVLDVVEEVVRVLGV